MSVKRYSREKMVQIWGDQNKYQIWFEIEAYAVEAMSKLGMVPEADVKNIWSKGAFNVERIDEIERETKHDVIAFLTNLAENIGDSSRFVHQGSSSR